MDATRRKRLLKIALLVLLVLVAIGLIVRFTGYRMTVGHIYGRSTESVLSFAPGEAAAPLVQDFPAGTEARNVVILIGDGMGFGQVTGARAALAGVNGRLFMERLPVTGWLTTYSANQLYTDSAAAATALATGHKTKLWAVGVDAEGQAVTTLLEAAAASGKAVGVVTDSYLWDATPAAFSSHVTTRGEYAAVAAQMADSGFDLLLGEEDSDLEEDDAGGEMLDAFRDKGFRIVRDAAALGSSVQDDAAVLALFAPEAINDPQQAPQLEELTAYALERLSRDTDGFALVIETEETDTGSHLGDFERMAAGVGALDRAIEAAVDFARRDRHTLVVVTADHETGGFAMMVGSDGETMRVLWSTAGHTANPVPLFAYGPGAELLGGIHDNTEVPRILARLLGLSLGE